MLGYQSPQEKLLPFILEEKQKHEHRRTLGESERKYINALECLLREEKKGVKKGTGKIVHDLWIEKIMWEIDEKI